jgi:hypothetical protein
MIVAVQNFVNYNRFDHFEGHIRAKWLCFFTHEKLSMRSTGRLDGIGYEPTFTAIIISRRLISSPRRRDESTDAAAPPMCVRD